MSIMGITQPSIIEISNEIRLCKYDGQNDFALSWYRDAETLMLVDGNTEPYDIGKLNRMYSYLDERGELYYIEIKVKDKYIPIGDVAFSKTDMPIVIGNKEYRGKGIGKKVVAKLVERGKELGYRELFVKEIYSYNIGSQKLFESVGFRRYGETSKGYSYRLNIN